jgi:GT2 family glycosyltransferase/glycosyltransferase involved in cell wall biosynthesis
VPAILFVSYSGLLGGAERILIDCSDALAGEHVLACPEGPLAERARAGGLRVLPIPARSLDLRRGSRGRMVAAVGAAARMVSHARELRALTLDLEPQLTVAWGMRSAIACLLGVRPFAFAHQDFLPGPAIAAAVRAAAARAVVVTACSQAVGDDLDPGGRRLGDRLRVVLPGVDAAAFAGDSAPVDPPEVVVLGVLASWKRPDLALEIAAAVAPAVPGLRVRLIGAPLDDVDPVPERLRRRASEPDLAGVAELAGARADPRLDLARARCLLHCAPREPFGMVLLEALAAGRPVVAPDAGGPREIVDPSCGVLYEPGSVAAGAAALLAVLSDPEHAREMGDAGRARVRARFDRSVTRQGFARAVGPVLERRAPIRRSPPPGALALVTVTHNSERSLAALIHSARRHLPDARLVVVDCASSDASIAVGREGGAHVVGLGENVGFGRACNRGLEEVREPVTALLNPDVELIDDSLLALASEGLRDDRPERILAPLVLNADGSRQDTAHPVPGSAPDLIRALVSPALVPGPALAPWRARRPRRVGWAVGAALLARTSTLRRLGPFDPSIFLYGEDLDLGLRAAADGVPTWFWPAARVLHHGAHSSAAVYGGEPYADLARARHDVVARRLGPARARRDDRAQALTFASRIVLKRALGRPADRERRRLAALRALRGTAIVR